MSSSMSRSDQNSMEIVEVEDVALQRVAPDSDFGMLTFTSGSKPSTMKTIRTG